MSFNKKDTQKLREQIETLAGKIEGYNKFNEQNFQKIYKLWTKKIRGLPVDSGNGKQLSEISAEKLRLINFANSEDLKKLGDTEKNSSTSQSVIVNAVRLIDTCLGVKISGGKLTSASKLKIQDCMFSNKDFGENLNRFSQCAKSQETNSAIGEPKNKNSILYALIELAELLKKRINGLSQISAPVNIEPMSVQPRRDINLDAGGFNQNENTPGTEKRTSGDLAGGPGRSLLECLQKIKDTINEGAGEALSQMLELAKSESGDIETKEQQYRELCKALKNINYDALNSSLDSFGESAPAIKKAVSNFKSEVECFARWSQPHLKELIMAVECLRNSLLKEIKTDSNDYKNAKTCVEQILPGFPVEKGSDNRRSLLVFSNNLILSYQFDRVIPRAIKYAIEEGDYDVLMELTDGKTVEGFVEAYKSVLTKTSKEKYESFFNSATNKEEFEAFIKARAISNIESKETLDGNNGQIANEMRKSWKKLKATCSSSDGGKYKPEKLTEEAKKCGDKLIEDEILEACDLEYRKKANSGNFVKIFIRYLERNYYDLKDDMRIFYYHTNLNYLRKIQDLYTARLGRYNNCIKYLKSKSKTSKKIYFIINQTATNVNGKMIYGHGNLTIIYKGQSTLIDTSPYADKQPVHGFKSTFSGTLQSDSDQGNCVAMALGALEGFLNKIRELKNKKTPESDNKPSDQDFGDYLDRFINAKVNISYLGEDDSSEKPLYPPKYLRYLQSTRFINRFLDEAEKIQESNPHYNAIKEAAEELKKVKSKYFREIKTKEDKESTNREDSNAKQEDEESTNREDSNAKQEDKESTNCEDSNAKQLKNPRFKNVRGKMKRQTEILKIFLFVEALKKHNLDPAEEIQKVRKLNIDEL